MHLKNELRLKSLLKGISWRLVGTVDTLFIAYIITGDTIKSLSIGGVEVFTKILLFYIHERAWSKVSEKYWNKAKKVFSFAQPKNNIINSDEWLVNRSMREQKNNHSGCVIWLTGLSGAGKTTIARYLEQKLFGDGYAVKILDGDNLRSGLNADLGFSEEDRKENIRRTAELAKAFVDTGFITIVSLITPKESFRELAKQIIGEKDFHLIYIDASLEECERRDVKGLYAKARRGEIKDFTGISARNTFEKPNNVDMTISTENTSIQEIIERLNNYFMDEIDNFKLVVK